MNSIADVLALTPGSSWHESVAIVQEIAAHLEPGQPLPAPEDLLLESDGSITFGFAGESARPQVADLASLLDTLLKKAEAPQALRDLVSENARDDPAHASIASFTKALAFYERPNRRSDLQALAGRLEGRSQAAQADRTLAEIRERVVRKSEEETKPKAAATPSSPEPKAVDRVRAIARARALAIAAVVILAAAGVSALTLFRGSSSNASANGKAATGAAANAASETAANANDTESAEPHAVSTEREGTDRHPIGTSAKGGESAHAKGSSQALSGSRSGASRGADRVSAFKPSRAGIAPVRPLPSLRAVPSASNAAGVAHTSFGESPAGAPTSRADDVAASAGATYTSANSEVTPPVWYRRQLPSEPAPDAKTGYFEIVIDTKGDVESVRLISPTRRYEERMLMAAAKAWKFRPARLNGEPVKYRMRVPITLTWTIDQ